ncbi:MAG TPA: CPBP family glutamic-type intramembrane protease [Methylomirabilota bacterium]|nr:CPBP family glutamic-type intramembrane protease [Methylomirabilota bacterium]
MEVFTSTFNSAAGRSGLFPPESSKVFLLFGSPAVIGACLWKLGWLPVPLAQVGGLVVLHGGLLALALFYPLGWSRQWARAVLPALASLLAGGVLSLLGPWWGWSLITLPVWLGFLSTREPAIRTLGLRLPHERWMLPAGAAIGGLLGVHLLVAASRALGYRVALFPLGPVLANLSYDLGVNLVTAELLFRGALFGDWWRRYGFWPAAVLSTSFSVLRYLIDPRLPGQLDALAGASFYLFLLGIAGCMLVRLSGSLFPSALASLFFFAAYRLFRQ